VVIMTAFALNDLIKEALQEGAHTCVYKPFEMDTILSVIKDIGDTAPAA
jgi:DNA-binding NtrC family response regulator